MIYFATNLESKFIKIGYSKDPQKRIKQLQTGNPDKLRIICVADGNRSTEYSIKEAFKFCRLPGTEWFENHPLLMKTIDFLKIYGTN